MTTGNDGLGGAVAPKRAARFLPMMDRKSAELALVELVSWVDAVLVPTYVQESTGRARWCSQWWEHPSVAAQLHALYLSWLDLAESGAGGTGPSAWHRDHLLPTLQAIRSTEGPLAGCKGLVDGGDDRWHTITMETSRQYEGAPWWLTGGPPPSLDTRREREAARKRRAGGA
ncbi:hypothetical protein GCM10027589_04240 [Actinocorallia lasiicapitis]